MTIYRVASRLYQGTLLEAATVVGAVPDEVDVIWLLAEEIEQLHRSARPLVFVEPIVDDPNGLPAIAYDTLRERAYRLRHLSVLTLCHMGENRSGLASALILMARGLSPQQAIAMVRLAVPPITNNPHVLWNPGFVGQLETWL